MIGHSRWSLHECETWEGLDCFASLEVTGGWWLARESWLAGDVKRKRKVFLFSTLCGKDDI